MVLDTLYKRTKTGAIQQWAIKTEPSLHGTAIIKDAGQIGGKQTRHEELITVGKNLGRSNETSPLEQAELQARSDWAGKRDEGYKSLKDLEIVEKGEYYTWEKDSTSHIGLLRYVLDKVLPQFNTDSNGQAKPMLAKPVDWNKVTYPCLVQPKLDGVRCLMVVDVEYGSVKFLSRNGKEYTTLAHIEKDILFHEPARGFAESFILDGEVYSDELSFQGIIKAVKKQRPESLQLKFRAYDVINDNVQSTRIYDTMKIVEAINSQYITMVETEFVKVKGRIKELHDLWVKQGYEGAIVRLEEGIYGQGQRSSSLLKVKEFDETEFEFVCFEQGQRKEDLIAVCVTTPAAGSVQFRAKMIGNKLSKQVLETECGELQGKPLTVKHFGWTDDGLPRFPIGKAFRDYE